ncbi:MAG: SRPBCC family protein, partial [Candidatus Ranarchaeia archaeon]
WRELKMETYSKSILVNANISEVWVLISDLPKLGDMLPQVHKVEWFGDKKTGVGIKSKWYPKHRPEKANIEEVVKFEVPHIFAWVSKRPNVPKHPESGMIEVYGQLELKNIDRYTTEVTFSEKFPEEIKDLSVFEGKTDEELNAIRDYFAEKKNPRRVKITGSKLVNFPPEALFGQIKDVKEVGEHVPTVKNIEMITDFSIGKGTRSKWNSKRVPGRWHIEEVTEYIENEEFGWISIGMEEKVRVKGILEFFKTDEGNTVINFTEEFFFSADDKEIKAHIEGIHKQLNKMEQDAINQ